MTRNDAIDAMRTALQRRSGKRWSVTGGKGTAYGWITITAPPARRIVHERLIQGHIGRGPQDYELYESPGLSDGYITDADRQELETLLNLESIHLQGVSIPAGNDYYAEYIDRANGVAPSRIGAPYWD